MNKDILEEVDLNEFEGVDSEEEEYSTREKELLENYRRQQKERQKSSKKTEILNFDESESENDSEDNDLISNSDIEENNENDDIPDSKAWGKQRKNYYYTDFVDQDYSTYNEKDEEYAQQEEEEAKLIQKRLAQELNEADFSLDIYTTIPETDDIDEVNVQDDSDNLKKKFEEKEIKLKPNLENISEREKQQLFKKDSPEFFGLTNDFQKYIEESQNVLQPFLEYVQNCKIKLPIIEFAETMNNVILTYCTNIAFYLTLKTKRISIKNHPVVKRLVQIRQILKQLEEKYDSFIKLELIKVTEMIESGSNVILNDIIQKEVILNTNKVEDNNSDVVPSSIDGEIDEDDLDVSERREITYQIAKNKGLTPHRKKDLKNPRVKHRNKYRKALIRRKGAVRTVRKEVKRYSGEISGIKATVKKGIKIKS